MDLYQEVTNRIIAQMEQDSIPWHKPWISSGSAVSHVTGKPYSLLNQMLLSRPGEYVTFKQCQQEGGKVRTGEKASIIVFWKWIEEKDPDTEEVKHIPFLRYFNVFHIDQCKGLTAKHTQKLPNTVSPDQTAEDIISGYVHSSGVRLNHEAGDRAFYRPSSDSITLPLMTQFKSTAEYYSTAFHELAHNTGHNNSSPTIGLSANATVLIGQRNKRHKTQILYNIALPYWSFSKMIISVIRTEFNSVVLRLYIQYSIISILA